jgi:hypothetical protein
MTRLPSRLSRCCRTWRLARNSLSPALGAGHLIRHLESAGHACVGRYDLPDDACTRLYSREDGAIFITNPGFSNTAPATSLR